MQESMKLSRDEIIICYQEDVARLMKYLSWLQNVSGTATSSIFSGEGIDKSSLTVPVYDSTLKLRIYLFEISYEDRKR